MKKGDCIVIGTILLAACIGFGILFWMGRQQAGNVRIFKDGKEAGIYSLDKDQEIQVDGGENVVVIENGKVRMQSASCPDQICVKQGEIGKKGESIICLPNEVVVSVEEGEESGVDAVTN